MMMMEAEDEVVKPVGCNDKYSDIIRGKRTKRQRPLSPLSLTMASCSSSSTAAENGCGGGRLVFAVSESSGGALMTAASPTVSDEFAESTEEEEDMANCLILLARGRSAGRRIVQDQPVDVEGGGLYVYQCKTCSRRFPSFQALGGHRASHKKPKSVSVNGNMEEKKSLVILGGEREIDHFNRAALSLQISNRGSFVNCQSKANKLHECSICGAEFTSGQALGGHMRRHRTFMNTTATTATTTTTTTLSVGTSTSPPQSRESKKKARNINLQLDLNLPAPEDDRHRESTKFPFAANEQVIVFSASPLVDCHY